MLFLLDGPMALITPDWGLVIWTSIVFLLLWFLLGKFAFRPIANALKERESDIDNALQAAEKARDEMKQLTADNERILNEAKEERAKIIKEAKDIRDRMITEARDDAKAEYQKEVGKATQEIQNQKLAAITDVKNMIGSATIELAEKVLKRELGSPSDQTAYINQEVDRIKLN